MHEIHYVLIFITLISIIVNAVNVNYKNKKIREKYSKEYLLNGKRKSKFYDKCPVSNKLNSLYPEKPYNSRNVTMIAKNSDNILLKIAVCTIGKNENLYIKEWVDYYKNLGINKIFIYDNNDVDGERFEDVINDYIETGFAKIYDTRGKIVSTKNHLEQLNGMTLQGQVYRDCYYKNYKNFNWIFFFDIDEFLCIDFKYNNIFEFLNDYNDYDGIKIQWRMYGDNGKLHYENKPVIERFKNKKNMNFRNVVKTILKCKTYDFDLLFNAHGPLNKELFIVNLIRKRISHFYLDNSTSNNKPYKNLPVYLDHFYSKSTEEYIKRKYNKTSAAHGKLKSWNFSLKSVKDRYFAYNKVTNDKLNMFVHLN